jgi:UMF1 family MFS transporter
MTAASRPARRRPPARPQSAPQRKAVIGWVLYDWANSAFALSVMAGFFPVFFKTYWSQNVDSAISTARLGYGTALAGMCIAILSPLLGAFADAGRGRKRFLGMFVFLGVVMTTALFFVEPGAWGRALAVFVCANIGFSCANLFYDSLLPQVAEARKLDMVSSLGYGIGYLGCGLLFVGNIFMVTRPGLFGFADAAQGVRYSFLSVAAWWALFSIPLFLWVREQRQSIVARAGLVAASLAQLRHTAREILGRKRLLLFLVAYWLYIDGVHTFIRMAADFGLSIGLDSGALMTALLIVQFVAFPSALLFGALAQRIGPYRSILIGIGMYIVVTVAGSLILRTTGQYTLFAALSGVPLGALQALSRSYFARSVPVEKSAEYFGFYNLMGKFAVFFGPALMGTVSWTVRSAGASSMIAARMAMLSIAALFIAGGAVLIAAERVKEPAL